MICSPFKQWNDRLKQQQQQQRQQQQQQQRRDDSDNNKEGNSFRQMMNVAYRFGKNVRKWEKKSEKMF
jgi:hypothetical protein